jgi:CelD/BcsL family acetyltransferase involved in cellulose biosynthesis
MCTFYQYNEPAGHVDAVKERRLARVSGLIAGFQTLSIYLTTQQSSETGKNEKGQEKLMQLKVIKTLDEFKEIKTEWNQLLKNCASHVPFLRHEYLVPWWTTLGGGEWEYGDLYIVTANSVDGRLVGIAPLFHTTNLDGKSALMLIGSIEISDYLDVIAADEDLPAFTEALLEHLDRLEAPAWDVLDLYNILEDSPTLALLEAAALKRGWSFKQEQVQPAPRISLPDSWEEYLAGIQKKQRHEIRRKIRRSESYFIPVRWYFADDENSLDDEIEAFLQLMAHDPSKEAFLTEIMRTQMRESIHTAYRAGWLQLAFLEVGDQKAAAYLNFDYGNILWVYNSGINFDFSDLSPGWVLLAYLIQWAIDHDHHTIDFMRGNEDYKYRFGGVDRFVVRVQISRES